MDKVINTQDCFYVKRMKILDVHYYFHFNINEKKFDKLEKLMQDISKKANVNFAAISEFTFTCFDDLQVEMKKWSFRKAIQDYYLYREDFENNVFKIKFGKKDVRDIITKLKMNISGELSNKINLFIVGYDNEMRIEEPEMEIYIQEISRAENN